MTPAHPTFICVHHRSHSLPRRTEPRSREPKGICAMSELREGQSGACAGYNGNTVRALRAVGVPHCVIQYTHTGSWLAGRGCESVPYMCLGYDTFTTHFFLNSLFTSQYTSRSSSVVVSSLDYWGTFCAGVYPMPFLLLLPGLEPRQCQHGVPMS